MSKRKSNSGMFRRDIKIEKDSSASNWADAIRELEESGSDLQEKKKAPYPQPRLPKPADPEAATRDITNPELNKTPRSLSRYEELCHTPTLKMESGDLNVIVAFSEVIAKVNAAGKSLNTLRKKQPELFPAHMYHTWVENLKETSTVMMKEFHHLRNGRQQKKYDKRYVCEKCHSVFMVPLPSDNTCDACRASAVPRGGGAYGGKVSDPAGDTHNDAPA